MSFAEKFLRCIDLVFLQLIPDDRARPEPEALRFKAFRT